MDFDNVLKNDLIFFFKPHIKHTLPRNHTGSCKVDGKGQRSMVQLSTSVTAASGFSSCSSSSDFFTFSCFSSLKV